MFFNLLFQKDTSSIRISKLLDTVYITGTHVSTKRTICNVMNLTTMLDINHRIIPLRSSVHRTSLPSTIPSSRRERIPPKMFPLAMARCNWNVPCHWPLLQSIGPRGPWVSVSNFPPRNWIQDLDELIRRFEIRSLFYFKGPFCCWCLIFQGAEGFFGDKKLVLLKS